jgi:hypothetical protein
MSDNWLQFIPTDPYFQPSVEAAEDARELLATFVPDSEEVTVDPKETVEFFHPGGNWSGVNCPGCDADLEEWCAFIEGQLREALLTGQLDMHFRPGAPVLQTGSGEPGFAVPEGWSHRSGRLRSQCGDHGDHGAPWRSAGRVTPV